MTSLIQQDIPLEMQYRPTVAYEANELVPNTVYIDANGRMGTGNLPEHLQKMTDPRQLQSFNPDPNAQAAALVNAAMALDGATRPTVVRKLNGQTTRVIYQNHERTPALPGGRRSLREIREGRSRNVPLQTASLADLHEAFEDGRSGLSPTVAKNLRARFTQHPEVVKGMAAVSRAKKVAVEIDPVTGIKMDALLRMPASIRERLTQVKTTHHGAKAPIIFHPKKTGYKTPGTPGYRGPTRAGLAPDVRIGAIGSMVPGTAPESVFRTEPAKVETLSTASAVGQGAEKLNRTLQKNTAAASKMAEDLSKTSAESLSSAASEQVVSQTEKVLEQASDKVVSPNGTTSWTVPGGYETAEVETGGKCGWKCWVLAALTTLAAGGGIYALAKKGKRK